MEIVWWWIKEIAVERLCVMGRWGESV